MPKQATNNEAGLPNRIPLAERMRPQTLDEVVGQDGVIGDGKILTEIVRRKEPVNIIFWGPLAREKLPSRVLLHANSKQTLSKSQPLRAAKKMLRMWSKSPSKTGISKFAPCFL